MVTDGVAVYAASQLAGSSAQGTAAADLTQSFNVAFEQARARQSDATDGGGLDAVLTPLLALGEQSAQLAADANPLLGNEMRPSELMLITMRSHQFLFQCELMANVANRASDGVQQLFRQQS